MLFFPLYYESQSKITPAFPSPSAPDFCDLMCVLHSTGACRKAPAFPLVYWPVTLSQSALQWSTFIAACASRTLLLLLQGVNRIEPCHESLQQKLDNKSSVSPNRIALLGSRKEKQSKWKMRETAKYLQDQSEPGPRAEEKLLKKNKPILGQDSQHSIRKLAVPPLASGQGPAAKRNGIIAYLASCNLLPPKQTWSTPCHVQHRTV